MSVTTTLERPADEPALQCRHHWVLESDAVAETRGRCRHCGAERVFPNHLPGERYAREWRENRLYATVRARVSSAASLAQELDETASDD
ncbi:MAG: hypothetical protein KatS3mg061_1283 [Dehalococcoidia bacterium]|nr:MAG: hypothetical protein KatS3mg061_1283 [Dehalococcoidia bacterium]